MIRNSLIRVAEDEGFEPPRASRPGGFQVLETTGTIEHYRTQLGAISGSCPLGHSVAMPFGDRWCPMVLAQV
jgi:hypothetical protein